jgi:hypothetical protein
MTRRLLVALIALFALTAAPASADHDKQYQWGTKEYPVLNPAMSNVKMPEFVGGPCTGVAKQAMPDGDGHDHLKTDQHKFECGAKKVFFDDLVEELSPRTEVVTGEMDVKGDLMVIAVAYPESGFLLYDVSNPASPKFLSHYRGEECENVIVDVDCGAYVDLSPDGKRVYMSVQQNTALASPSPNMRPAAIPGIEVIDISIPALPVLLQATAVQGTSGVHTAKSFVVPEKGAEGPRAPGEYVVSVVNSTGLAIHKVQPTGNLVQVNQINVGETHDTFIQDDPILGRTLLYAAGGFSSGFYVFDITDPSKTVIIGEWDPTPECPKDWYAHTIDVSVKNGKRILTMPNELIDFFGTQEGESCGTLQGNGDYTGNMWFVDISDFSKLPKFTINPPDNTEARLTREDAAAVKAKSESLISSIYYNPALRAGGELVFSLHNQQIVGDKIYISQYHGGIVVVDAKEAFEGKNVRPKETAIYVPSEGEGRPIPPDAGAAGVFGNEHFVTGFIDYRPLVWDTFYVNGHIMIPDMTGGLTVIREDNAPAAIVGKPVNPNGTGNGGGGGSGGEASCKDKLAPSARVSKAKLTRKRITLSGRAADKGCSRVARVSVAVAKVSGKKCRFLSSLRKFSKARSCRKPLYLTARGTTNWSYSLKTKLGKGRYLVMARSTDTSGNRSRLVRKKARAR